MSTFATTLHKFHVFLSFRGLDTRRNFISFLYRELIRRHIRTFKDDKELETGRRISSELIRAIEESKFAVVVISANYAASTWCLEELVKIMDFANKGSLTVMPIFYGVDPCHVRWQIGEVAEQFKKHEARQDHEKLLSWRQALTNLASISGLCSLKWEDDSKLVDKITERISMSIDTTTTTSNGSNIEGIDAHMKALSRLLDLNSKKSKICQHFESHCFLENVKRISHMSYLQEELRVKVQGKCLSKSRLKNQKVLLVADDVSEIEQLDALAEDFNCFGPGSIVIITTRDKQLLSSYGIELLYEVGSLRFQEVRQEVREAGSLRFQEVRQEVREVGSLRFQEVRQEVRERFQEVRQEVREVGSLRFQEVRQEVRKEVRTILRQYAFKDKDISAACESVMCRETNFAMEWLGCLRVRSG
ncbi:hypothetical protein EUTSA_v10018617mg [Eutrema salsugineum]|uniref:TIR domain-containing protein n=1 Tax=Eutrema salsugineum TaxID=72664 RepID=V4JRJ4_EUTSA|nr:hypothetical protein EUTSA_v10018617mg [Eutrema salsugineum]